MSNLKNVTIGDSISLGLNRSYPSSIEIVRLSNLSLSKVGYTSKLLYDELQKSEVFLSTENLILSIGSNDLWISTKGSKDKLISQIRRVFPNSNYYILNGNYGWGSLSPNAVCDANCWISKSSSYISYFLNNGFKIIGSLTMIKSHPTEKDDLFKSFISDLYKYKIIINVTTTTTTSTTTTTTTIFNDVIPQETSRGDLYGGPDNSSPQNEKKNNITSPGIVNIFRTNIKPSTIDINSPDQQRIKDEIMNGLGFVPIIWYNAYQIDLESVEYLTIYDDGIIPAMKFSFLDSLGIMKDKAFPLDDTKITLFLNSRSKELRPIHIEFKIRNFVNDNGIMSIDAILDVNGLYFKKFKSYSKMSSNKALQEVCRDIGLGFNTNITDSNDIMTWINTGKRPYEFMMDIIDHAYISDESFISGNIDLYYNFNFVDIQKELSRNIEQELGVVTIGIEEILKLSDVESISNLILTNDASMEGTNCYFYSYRIINNATTVAIENGYMDIIKYYSTIDKSILDFTVNSLNNNADKSIILKGAPQDDNFFKNNVNFVYNGKIDTDNSHKNYNYSDVHNDRNIYETQKVSLEIEISYPNFNIYKFQKIKVILSSNTPTPASPMINQRLSGDWIIVDIRYAFYEGSLRQIVTLVKRELEISIEELETELISIKKVPGAQRYPDGRGLFSNPPEGPSEAPPAPKIKGRLKGGGKINKRMTFAEATRAVILNLEGGYFHPDMLTDGRVRDSRYSSSGETMYGLDRRAGGPAINACVPCLEFWGTIDKENARKNWKWNYMPNDPLQSKLVNLVVQIMEPIFNKTLNAYVPEPEIQNVIKSDGRLLFNFIYAQWNGPGWFKGWARIVRAAYKEGKTKSDDLVVLFVEKRVDNRGVIGNKNNNSLIAQGGRKIAGLVGVDIA